MSRITEPTEGRIVLRGRVGSLLEVGTGFHPELTGRENVFLNGAILGMTQREIRKKFDEIVAAHTLSDFGLCEPERITVIPDGHEHVRRWRPSLSRYAASNTDQRPFILVVGSRARHKNVSMLFAIAKDIDALGLDILVAGASARAFSSLEAGPIPRNVHVLGFVTDDDLAALYQNALCFAFRR